MPVTTFQLLTYDRYIGSFEISAVLRNGVHIIPVHVPVHESHSAQAVVAAYRTAAEEATCSVRGILFCNPHNPHGHICPVEIIDALLQYCEEADLHFVSDEIYALSTFGAIDQHPTGCGEMIESPATEFASVLSRDLQGLGVNGSRVHLLYSISKDLGSSGIRLVGLSPSKTFYLLTDSTTGLSCHTS